MNFIVVSSQGIDTSDFLQFLQSSGFRKESNSENICSLDIEKNSFVEHTTMGGSFDFAYYKNLSVSLFFLYLTPRSLLASLLGTVNDDEIIRQLSNWLRDANLALNLYKQNRKKIKLINYEELCSDKTKLAELLQLDKIDSQALKLFTFSATNLIIADSLVETIQEVNEIYSELEACSVVL